MDFDVQISNVKEKLIGYHFYFMSFYMLHHFHLVMVTLYNNISPLFIMEQFKNQKKV